MDLSRHYQGRGRRSSTLAMSLRKTGWQVGVEHDSRSVVRVQTGKQAEAVSHSPYPTRKRDGQALALLVQHQLLQAQLLHLHLHVHLLRQRLVLHHLHLRLRRADLRLRQLRA